MTIVYRDSRDRATVEGWLTVQAAQTLYKLSEKGILGTIEGVLREGKEAVIILARDPGGKALIIKVYKIATSRFHHMSRYIIGDPRFQGVRHQRRSLIFAWCKKEFANLKRARDAGVNCPEPLAYADNLLVMSFIGEEKGGELAPSLNEMKSDLGKKVAAILFVKIVAQLVRLYNDAGLIHGDLSQFNILVWKGEPWLIDMSAAVLKAHPEAEEFLKRDVKNLVAFFKKLGVAAEEDTVMGRLKSV